MQTERKTEGSPRPVTNINDIKTATEAVQEAPTPEYAELFENISISDKNATMTPNQKPKKINGI